MNRTKLPLAQLEHYVNVVIPNIEAELITPNISVDKANDLISVYYELLRLCAHDNFICFNKYLELDEDHTSPHKAFYFHRKDALAELFEALNDMEIYDKYDMLLISTPPRIGKSTVNIRFLSWICGRHPESTELATSYSESITASFYLGCLEIMLSERYKDIFNDAQLVNQNAKRLEIWLQKMKRYPTITFVPIGGSMTGRSEAGKYLACDDLVSGLEEALSYPRMEKLWNTYTVNAKQRKLDYAKEIHIATIWSVHDVISKLAILHKDNDRCKIIKKPCFNEQGKSNFDFFGGFSTEYYKNLQKEMDKISFNALYMCEAVEREGLLYNEDEIQYYLELPNEKPDTIVSVCDSKNMGNDFVASPVGYIYGDTVYIEDVVYNNGLPEVTRPLVANLWLRNNVVRADVEMNNGGNYFAEELDRLVKAQGGKTGIRIFFSGNNKNTKIITYSDFVKKNFVFKSPSLYSPNGEYAQFMKGLLTWTQTGNNAHDDAPDSIAMLAQLIQDISMNSVKILNRKVLQI